MAGDFWENVSSALNPLRALNSYKAKNLYKSSLLNRFEGFFYFFAGKVHDPEHTDDLIGGKNETIKGSNQIGIFDLITLGIPFALEWFFRGNFLPRRSDQIVMTIFFCFAPPIIPILFVIRNGLALIPTILLSPFIVVGYLWDEHQLKKENQKKLETKYSPEKAEEYLKIFNSHYQILTTALLDQNQSNRPKQASETATQSYTIASIAAKKLTKRNNYLADKVLGSNPTEKAQFSHKVNELNKYTSAGICSFFEQNRTKKDSPRSEPDKQKKKSLGNNKTNSGANSKSHSRSNSNADRNKAVSTTVDTASIGLK